MSLRPRSRGVANAGTVLYLPVWGGGGVVDAFGGGYEVCLE